MGTREACQGRLPLLGHLVNVEDSGVFTDKCNSALDVIFYILSTETLFKLVHQPLAMY